MARIAYVNGRYLPVNAGAVSIEDRGYQFADGVYEVIKSVKGELLDFEKHLERLKRSLSELAIDLPLSAKALEIIIRRTVNLNRLPHAIAYVQVSRGVAPRNHLFPKKSRPQLVVTVRKAPFPSDEEFAKGCKIISMAETRWARRDIKSISLLANVLAKQKASQAGAREAVFLDTDGMVTECSSSNLFIITKNSELVTRPLGNDILAGITRQVILQVAKDSGLTCAERAFTLQEAKEAKEAFLTSTSSLVMPVTQIDDCVIGNGNPGEITLSLLNQYLRKQHLGVT